MKTHAWVLAVAFPILAGCALVSGGAPKPTVTDQQSPPSPSPVLPPMTPAPATPAAQSPAEAILILEPGAGSRLISPIHVAGIADPAFEQTLAVRVILDDGSQLVPPVPVRINAEIGQRGPFAVDLPAIVAEERNVFIQVYVTSPRDGGLTHLASVGARLAPAGPATILPGREHVEDIVIRQPAQGAVMRGGVASVTGWGLASFEQTLLIEIHDANDAVVGQQSVTVQAPDYGQPGAFAAEIPYAVTASGPGRVVVRDLSPAHGGDVHRSSVEIVLEP